MKKNPALQGVVFDSSPILFPAATYGLPKHLGLQDRFSVVAGDFFASVPPADLYLLKLIFARLENAVRSPDGATRVHQDTGDRRLASVGNRHGARRYAIETVRVSIRFP